MASKTTHEVNKGKVSQSIKLEAGANAQGLTQITNFYTDADTKRLQQELTSEKEKRWHEKYQAFRAEAKDGYFDAIRESVSEIIVEIEQYEAEETPINTDLKAKVYRLAAVSYLPRHTNGDPQRCSEYLATAMELSEGDDLIQCKTTLALQQYDAGDITAALDTLHSVSADDALRLRFAIFIETNQKNKCKQMINDGLINLVESQSDPNWVRAIMGYHTMTGNLEASREMAELLLSQAPTASSYEVAAESVLRLTYEKLHIFCRSYDVLPDFHLGLDLSDLIDLELQAQAAGWFAQAGVFYEQHKCERDAIRCYSKAIHLCIDEEANRENLPEWASVLARLDSRNSLLAVLKRTDFDLSEIVGPPPNLLDFAALLNDTTTAPTHILSVAKNSATTKSSAIQIANLLEGEFERFQAIKESFPHYVFTVLRLRQMGDDIDRALVWLEKAGQHFSHPRFRPLSYVLFFSEQDEFDRAKEWLDKALVIAQNHPEVLSAAFVIHHQLPNHKKALYYAQALFTVMRTRQTLERYIIALWDSNQLDDVLDLLNSVDDIILDENYIRENRVRVLVRLERIIEAHEDLEWIYRNAETQSFHLFYLAGSYQLLGEDDQAISILRKCVNQFPDEVQAYLFLSSIYLNTGKPGKSFTWALKAYRRFPDDPRATMHLFFISHPTGKELLPEVGDAFRAFLPGGKFADQSPFIRISMDEFPKMLHDSKDKGVDLSNIFRAGKIPWLILCAWRNVSPFGAHHEIIEFGGAHYIAQGEQLQDITNLLEDCPKEIVLDYTALLTIWTLVGANTLPLLSQYFERIYIPNALRSIWVEEQNRLATFGQLARYQAQCAVRDALNRWGDKIVWHDEAKQEEGRDVSGSHTENAISQQNSLVYLNEHLSPEEPVPETVIGIAAIADLLMRIGEIDALAQQDVKRHAHPTKECELTQVAHLEEERELLISIFTLETWAMYAELSPLFGYFARIHLVEPARRMLLDEISTYESKQHILDTFREMRQLLRLGEESDFVVFEAIPEAEYVNRQISQQKQGGNSDEPMELDPTRQILFDYYDELVGIASRNNLPIWSDDRFTKILNIEGKHSTFTFSTDSFLAFAHSHPKASDHLSPKQYHTYYDKLVAWGYYFLPINSEHILWHLHQGRNAGSKPLNRLFEHYRESVIAYWEFAKNALDVSGNLGVELLGTYHQQLIVTLYRLYKENVPIDTGATVFAKLDLSRHAGALVWGNEPSLFASLFIHAITVDLPSNEFEHQGKLPSERLLDYSHWLNQVILRSGVPFEVIDEAWYQLIRYSLVMIDEAQDDSQRQVGLIYLGRILNLVPTHTTDYLLSTDVGPRLQNEFGLQIQELITFKVEQETGGPLEFRLPVIYWNQDLQLTIAKYLAEPTKDPVTVGQVTFKAEPVATGSIFLRAQVIPTKAYGQFPDLRVPTQIICLLPGFTNPDTSHRETLWEIGSDALQRHQIPTDSWEVLRENFLQQSDEGTKVGHTARQLLLGTWPVAREYLAQSTKLNPHSILQVLDVIAPGVVRGWLRMPSLDWTSSDDLVSWASKIPLTIDSMGNGHNLGESLAPFGCSIFPDAPIFQQRMLSLLSSMVNAAQREVICQLMVRAEASASLSLKSNITLIIRNYLV